MEEQQDLAKSGEDFVGFEEISTKSGEELAWLMNIYQIWYIFTRI